MPRKKPSLDTIIDAGLSLAATRAWRDVTLADIATEAKMPLADLAGLVSSKTDILAAFVRRTDQMLLRSLQDDPVDGDLHDRLFDIIMRRLELLAPWRAGVAGIIHGPARGPAGWARLAGAMSDSQNWMAEAAGLETSTVKQLGLSAVYVRALSVWARDDDPGMARTMASLDSDLRSGAAWLGRLEAPAALGVALSGLARAMWRSRFGRAGATGKSDQADAAQTGQV